MPLREISFSAPSSILASVRTPSHLISNSQLGSEKGSSTVEASIKLARQYFIERGEPQRHHFIARRQSYHGNTLGALAAGGNAWRREPYAPLLSSAFSHVTPAFAYHEKRDDEQDADFVARLAAELDAEFRRLGPETVAAFIAEPVVGATAGCVTAPEGYFRAVREICNRHGALLTLDEVMCGMGRTGTTHAWEQEGIAPDIQAIAKGLGAGEVKVLSITDSPEPEKATPEALVNIYGIETPSAAARAPAGEVEVKVRVVVKCSY